MYKTSRSGNQPDYANCINRLMIWIEERRENAFLKGENIKRRTKSSGLMP